jgi:hypothetical protein
VISLRRQSGQRGSVLVLSVFVVTMLVLYGVILLDTSWSERRKSERNSSSIQAFYWMEGRAKVARYLAAERLLNSMMLDSATLHNDVGGAAYGDKFRPGEASSPDLFPTIKVPR